MTWKVIANLDSLPEDGCFIVGDNSLSEFAIAYKGWLRLVPDGVVCESERDVEFNFIPEYWQEIPE